MAYLGTSDAAKKLGVERNLLYGLIRSGEVAAPVKGRGRFLWRESDIAAAKQAIFRRRLPRGCFVPADKRYFGGKAKWAAFIRSVAEELRPGFSSFADLFAGVGGVAAAFSDKILVVNDISDSAAVFLRAWFLPEHADAAKIAAIISEYNALPEGGENYVSNNFGDYYFSRGVAGKIGRIREDISLKCAQGEINAREEAALIAALLYAMDDAANIYAHYDTFKKQPVEWGGLHLLPPSLSEGNPANRVFQTDANMLASFAYADVVYLDPPADSRQYCDIYHLPDNIARWEKPEVSGIARKPKRGHKKSLYCKKGAGDVYAALVRDVRAGLILASLSEKDGCADRSAAKVKTGDVLAALAKRGKVHIVFPPLPQKGTAASAQLLLPCEFMYHKPASTKWRSYVEGCVAVCTPGEFGPQPIDSPINFTGSKYRLLEQILPYFPRRIEKLIDMFAGGCSVGLSAGVGSVVFVDNDTAIMGLFAAMRDYRKVDFLSAVIRIIQKSGLSFTLCYGYKTYGVTSEEGLAEVNHAAYNRLRDEFNAMSTHDLTYWACLYVLIVYGYNNMPRFNAAGNFNLTVGKRDFNASMARKLADFTTRIQSMDVCFAARDFRRFDLSEIGAEDFVFLDPPFMGAGAYYNVRGWRSDDERDLMALLTRLDTRGTRYALLGALSYGGMRNEVLAGWLSKNPTPHRVIRIPQDNVDTALILNY